MQSSDDSPKLLRDVAYEWLRDAITQGELPPATPLSEVQLAREMQISRTPIREALQQLEREGLVRIIPGRSASVAAPSMTEVMEVVHLRFLLEPELARLAARSATEEQKETLEQTLEQMEVAAKEKDWQDWTRLDNLFHETLSEACPNKLLSKQVMQLRNRVHYMINDSQADRKRVDACTDEHRIVADAIIAGDTETAESAMRAHIEKLRASLFARFAHL